ncbi:MAG: hypothetical protein J6I85_04305 [Clostridia bacterium]|nr:hypothetical protein [Clostridia bacterium]
MEKILVMVARILFLGIFILPYAVQTHIEKKEGNERDPIEDRHALTPGAKVLAFLAILLALTLDGLAVYASPDKRRIYFGLAMLLNVLILIGVVQNAITDYEISTGKLKTLAQMVEDEKKQKEDDITKNDE